LTEVLDCIYFVVSSSPNNEAITHKIQIFSVRIITERY